MNDIALNGIRTYTSYDIEDAQAVINKVCACGKGERNTYSKRIKRDFLVAVALHVSYNERDAKLERSLSGLLSLLEDSSWDCPEQILEHCKRGIHDQNLRMGWVNEETGELATQHPYIGKIMNIILEDESDHVQEIVEEAKVALKDFLNKNSTLLFAQVLSQSLPEQKVKTEKEKTMPNTTHDFVKDFVKFEDRLFLLPHVASEITTERDAEKSVVEPVIEKEENKRLVEIFSGAAIKQMKGAENRFREVPQIDLLKVGRLKNEFENMQEPLAQIIDELTLNSLLPPADFRISPILFLGGPGTGKTAFANALAKKLQVPRCKFSGEDPSFVLTGTNPTWKDAAPGRVIKQFEKHESTSPLFFVDELNKKNNNQYPLTNALLDLLEPENAKSFEDQYFQVEFDASHAIWILTANTIEDIPDPLLSRLNIFEIKAPCFEQRMRIIKMNFKTLNQKTGKKIRVGAGEIHRLAERIDIDLRKMNRIVQDGFISALRNKVKTAKFILPKTNKTTIGFY